ncbi:MAG: hypothetical protein Q9193_005527 [Seirophora villosa]
MSLIHRHHNEGLASLHVPSALLTNSSYSVHASAELTAFLPILSPNPSNRLLTPSSLTICRLACTMFAYLPGINCNRVLTASNGFVRAVASPAASTPLVKLIGTDDDDDERFISPSTPEEEEDADVELARVRRVADRSGAEAREEAPEAFALEDGGGGAGKGAVGVEAGFVAHFDDGDGHHDDAG